MSTKLTLIFLTSIILFLFVSLETSFSQAPTTTAAVCGGSISFTLSPNQGFAGDTITAGVSNLRGEGCMDKRVYIKESSCQGLQYCSCLLNKMPEGLYSCVCTFRAPPTPYATWKESRQSTFTYYVCVDLDNDGIFNQALGEQAYANLLVYSRYAPLSLVTESIIIIIALGVLLTITIVVFRMSLRRR